MQPLLPPPLIRVGERRGGGGRCHGRGREDALEDGGDLQEAGEGRDSYWAGHPGRRRFPSVCSGAFVVPSVASCVCNLPDVPLTRLAAGRPAWTQGKAEYVGKVAALKATEIGVNIKKTTEHLGDSLYDVAVDAINATEYAAEVVVGATQDAALDARDAALVSAASTRPPQWALAHLQLHPEPALCPSYLGSSLRLCLFSSTRTWRTIWGSTTARSG